MNEFHGAGDFKHKITIQRKTLSKDSQGISQDIWSNYMTAMAAYDTQSAGEFFKISTSYALEVAVFFIRFRTGIDKTMRIISPFGIFNINSVIDTKGTHREIQMQCTSEAQNA